MNFEEAELIVLKYRSDNDLIQKIRTQCYEYKKALDYIMHRFIDQFGQKLDVERSDKYHRFLKVQNENYSKITRLERVMSAYVK